VDESFKITEALTLTEAAPLAGVSYKTLLRRIKDGELEAHKNGSSRNSHYLVTEEALAKCFPLRKRTRLDVAS
jgi:excisionase family DNA binding protein